MECNNKFKASLKINVPNIKNVQFNNMNETNLLLLKLGLFPLPNGVQASLSDDHKYLNIKLAETEKEKHIQYQFPLESPDLSALEQRKDYQELLDRYDVYINDYIHEKVKNAILESKHLQEKFPGLVFNIKIRVKSRESYLKKLNKNILEGKSPYINDIIGERIIISRYNISDDIKICENEQLLTNMCYEVAKALYDFRGNTNFKMAKNVEPCNASTDKCYISKDYIEHKKDNGYQSLHISITHKNNPDFCSETQIRTFEMENISKKSNKVAHTKYKSRPVNDLAAKKVPLYFEITSFKDEFGDPITINLDFESRFYHFYNSDRDLSAPSQTPPITYKKFRKEQYELENLLNIRFKDIRQGLKHLESKNKDLKYKEKEEEQEVL